MSTKLNEAAWDSDNLDGAFDFLFGDDEWDLAFEDLEEWESGEEVVLESDLEESAECGDCTDCEPADCDNCLVEETTECDAVA